MISQPKAIVGAFDEFLVRFIDHTLLVKEYERQRKIHWWVPKTIKFGVSSRTLETLLGLPPMGLVKVDHEVEMWENLDDLDSDDIVTMATRMQNRGWRFGGARYAHNIFVDQKLAAKERSVLKSWPSHFGGSNSAPSYETLKQSREMREGDHVILDALLEIEEIAGKERIVLADYPSCCRRTDEVIELVFSDSPGTGQSVSGIIEQLSISGWHPFCRVFGRFTTRHNKKKGNIRPIMMSFRSLGGTLPEAKLVDTVEDWDELQMPFWDQWVERGLRVCKNTTKSVITFEDNLGTCLSHLIMLVYLTKICPETTVRLLNRFNRDDEGNLMPEKHHYPDPVGGEMWNTASAKHEALGSLRFTRAVVERLKGLLPTLTDQTNSE